MTSDSTCCPYCNALVAVPPDSGDSQRIVCRRCGEAFPYHGPSQEEPAAALRASRGESVPLLDASPPGPTPSPSPFSRKKSALLGVLALLVVGGLVVLILLKWGHGPTTNSDEKTATAHVPPTELVGLGFLPDDTKVMAAIHLGEVLRQPIGQELLDRLQENNVRTRILEQWTGIRLEEMDHAVLGMTNLGELFPPRIILVLRTLRAYDSNEVQLAAKARRWNERSVHPLYRFPVEGLGLEPFLRFVDERTLVVTLRSEDADRVPERPRQGIEHLQEKIRQLLHEEIGPTAQAWMVGHVRDWDEVSIAGILKELRRDDWNILQGVQTWSGSVSCHDDLVFNGLMGCRDESAAGAVVRFLKGERISSLALRPEAVPILRKIQQTLGVTQQGTRVELQATTRFETSKLPERGEKP